MFIFVIQILAMGNFEYGLFIVCEQPDLTSKGGDATLIVPVRTSQECDLTHGLVITVNDRKCMTWHLLIGMVI
jgi:hypothetical protein